MTAINDLAPVFQGLLRRLVRVRARGVGAPTLLVGVGVGSGTWIDRAFPGLASMVLPIIGNRARNGPKEIESR